MKKKLKVTITGFAGTGKTALACAIRELCEQHDIKCTIYGAEDDLRGVEVTNWSERLDGVANKDIEVEIETIQAIRHSL